VSAEPFEARTAILVALDELAPAVAAARYNLGRYGENEIELHITLLFPFVPRPALEPGVIESLRAFFVTQPAPVFVLDRVEAFAEGAVYAAPSPAAPLQRLIGELAVGYPDTPPYGGVFDDIVPHATLAKQDGDGAVRSRVEPLLPVECRPERASLFEEFEPLRWRELEPLPFGAG
jgi:2'-5' RNA ligase